MGDLPRPDYVSTALHIMFDIDKSNSDITKKHYQSRLYLYLLKTAEKLIVILILTKMTEIHLYPFGAQILQGEILHLGSWSS